MAKVLIAAALVIGFYAGSRADTGNQHWRTHQALEPIVMLSKFAPDGSTIIHGTGVVLDVSDTLPVLFVVTNKHIVGSHDSLRIHFRTYNRGDDSTLFIHSKYKGILHVKRALVPSSDDSDFVAIPVSRRSTPGLQGYGVDSVLHFDSLRYGEPVEFWGYPIAGLADTNNFLPMVRCGNLSVFVNQETLFGGKELIPGVILIDGLSDGGNSGGPIYARRLNIQDGVVLTSHLDQSRLPRRLLGIIAGHFSRYEQRISIIGGKDTIVVKDEVPTNLAYGYSVSSIVEFIESRLEQGKEVQK